MYLFYTFSTDSSKEEDSSVICCSGSWEKGWLVSFFSKPLILSEELFICSMSERKTWNTKNQSGLGFLPSVVAKIRPNCLYPVQRTAVSDCRPSQHPPDSLFLLYSTAQGLLSPCSWKAEVLVLGSDKGRGTEIKKMKQKKAKGNWWLCPESEAWDTRGVFLLCFFIFWHIFLRLYRKRPGWISSELFGEESSCGGHCVESAARVSSGEFRPCASAVAVLFFGWALGIGLPFLFQCELELELISGTAAPAERWRLNDMAARLLLLRAGWRTAWNHALVPFSVILQRVQDLLSIWVDKIGPGFPQRMNDVINKTHLKERDTKGTNARD